MSNGQKIGLVLFVVALLGLVAWAWFTFKRRADDAAKAKAESDALNAQLAQTLQPAPGLAPAPGSGSAQAVAGQAVLPTVDSELGQQLIRQRAELYALNGNVRATLAQRYGLGAVAFDGLDANARAKIGAALRNVFPGFNANDNRTFPAFASFGADAQKADDVERVAAYLATYNPQQGRTPADLIGGTNMVAVGYSPYSKDGRPANAVPAAADQWNRLGAAKFGDARRFLQNWKAANDALTTGLLLEAQAALINENRITPS